MRKRLGFTDAPPDRNPRNVKNIKLVPIQWRLNPRRQSQPTIMPAVRMDLLYSEWRLLIDMETLAVMLGVKTPQVWNLLDASRIHFRSEWGDRFGGVWRSFASGWPMVVPPAKSGWIAVMSSQMIVDSSGGGYLRPFDGISVGRRYGVLQAISRLPLAFSIVGFPVCHHHQPALFTAIVHPVCG